MTPLNQAMHLISRQRNSLFIGQGVAFPGHAMHADFDGIPREQLLEVPVIEELQLGLGIGLSLQGYLPLLLYPRFDFLLRAADQLVNHLDKLELMSRGQFCPKVIIRTRVGSTTPLDPGPQHSQRHTEAFRLMLSNVFVDEITVPGQILPAYQAAIDRRKSTLIVENFG